MSELAIKIGLVLVMFTILAMMILANVAVWYGNQFLGLAIFVGTFLVVSVIPWGKIKKPPPA